MRYEKGDEQKIAYCSLFIGTSVEIQMGFLCFCSMQLLLVLYLSDK